MPNWIDQDETTFLNVDLDIRSGARLEPLVAAFGERVVVHYVGPEGGHYGAHLELARSHGKDAGALIGALARLVRKLPKAGRKLWEQAQSREFNMGIQAGLKPRSYELRLSAETLQSVASVAGVLVVTIYAVEAPSELLPRGGIDAKKYAALALALGMDEHLTSEEIRRIKGHTAQQRASKKKAATKAHKAVARRQAGRTNGKAERPGR